jgi:hypothetical protein
MYSIDICASDSRLYENEKVYSKVCYVFLLLKEQGG